MTNMLKHNGTIYTVKALKTMRLHITRYICGQPLFVNNSRVGIDKTGWPILLLPLKPLLEKGTAGKKLLLTILLLSRTLELKKGEIITPNYKTITDQGPTRRYTIPTGMIQEFVIAYNLNSPKPEFKSSDVFLSIKGSPSGKASLTAPVALKYLSYGQMDWILKLGGIEGAKYFEKIYNWAFKKDLSFLEKKNSSGLTGEISFVKDPECKLRLIAMLDYTSQLFLKPVHEILFKLLKRIPMDRTFTQDPKHQWLENNHKYWSLDLSAATDRFPVHLQQRLLGIIFQDSSFASAWKNLLVERKFSTPEGNRIQYSVGQPMGAYSSWPAFTLCHHLVVWYCAKLSKIDNFDQYIILGDDIVIKNDIVAKRYQQVMAKLGVELSLNKTHVSQNTYEFAKRWFQDGIEITGLPMRGLVKNILNPFIVYTIFFDYFKIKGNMYIMSFGLISFLQRFYQCTNLWNGKRYVFHSQKFVPRLELFALVLNHSFGFASYDLIRKLLAQASSSNGDYVVPSQGYAAVELQRVLGLGLGQILSSNIRKTMQIFNNLIEHKINYKIEDLNEFSNIPVFDGLINHIQASISILQKLETGLPVLQVAKHLCELNIDSIFSKERNKILFLVKVGEMFTKGLAELAEENEIMYGSSIIESTYTALSSLGNRAKTTLVDEYDKLTKIQNQTYVAEPSMDDLADRWAKFYSL